MSNVTWEQVGDGILAELDPIYLAQAGRGGAYLRQLAWHAGEFSSREAMERSGIAGRCPAVLVDFGGEKVLRTMAGGQRQHVEAEFLTLCASDSMRSTRSRELGDLLPLLRDVRERLHGRRFDLEIERFTYAGIQPVAQEPTLFAFALRWRTRYHIDLSRAPSPPVEMSAAGGAVIDEDGADIGNISLTFP